MADAGPPFRLDGARVWVAGHRGMVGSSVARRLAREACEVVTAPREELDLRRQRETEDWLAAIRPDAIVLAAATVGGILANDTRPAEFIYDNLAIEANVIHAALRVGVRKLLFLGSSCIYPRLAPQPIVEDALLSGPLEPTNEWYAVAKIAGLKMCQAYRKQYGCDFIAAMPTNIYGPGADCDPTQSHVVPALLAKAHRAKRRSDPTLEVWGSGRPRREFLYVDDLADALVFLIERYSDGRPINIGSGFDLSIAELAAMVVDAVGFEGGVSFDPSRPDGAPRKLLDSARVNALGWRPRVDLASGLRETYRWIAPQLDEALA